MKKTLAVLLAMTTISTVAFASRTSFDAGKARLDIGMWNTKGNSKNFSESGKWSFDGAITYTLKDGISGEFRHHKLNTQKTSGSSNELNAIYSLRNDLAVFGGLNHISMTDFVAASPFGKASHTNNSLQIGVMGTYPLDDKMEAYARASLGTRKTGVIEAGVDYELDKNINVNAGYRYLTTKANSDDNISYQGFMAGVSYRFGAKSNSSSRNDYYDDNDYYDYGRNDYEEDDADMKESIVEKKETPKKIDSAKENDYYVTTIHFGADSAIVRADQKKNLDNFIKKAKESKNKFKIVAYVNDDTEKELAGNRVRNIAQYAVDNGLEIDQLVGVSRKDDSAIQNKGTRIDIYEHK